MANQEGNAHLVSIPLVITVASSIDQVCDYVEYVLKEQRRDDCMVRAIKEFLFNQHIDGSAFLRLSEDVLFRYGLKEFGLVNALEQVKNENARREDANQDNWYSLFSSQFLCLTIRSIASAVDHGKSLLWSHFWGLLPFSSATQSSFSNELPGQKKAHRSGDLFTVEQNSARH
jgi:hypothetical protein